MVNLVKDGKPLRMSKRAGTDGHPRGPRRGDRRRRRPLRAGPLLDRLAASTSTSTCGPSATNDNPVFYVQYAHARVVEPAAQRRRARASTEGDASTRSCSTHDREGDLLGALGEFPRGRGDRGRAARAAPGRPLPRGAGRHLPPVLRRLPGAAARRRGGRPTCTGRGSGWSRRPGSCSPTGCGCSASARPSGCSGRRARHPAGPRSRRAGPRGPARPGRRPTSTRSTRPCGRWGRARRRRRRLTVRGHDVRDLVPRARHPGVRPRRGRLPRAAAATTARRSAAR